MPAEVLQLQDFDDYTQIIRKAASILLSGGLVVYPTDTSYGLACDPRIRSAFENLFTVKRRNRDRGVPLLFADFNQCTEYHEFGDLERIITRIFWPGALTLVVTANDNVPNHFTLGRKSIVIRVPNHELPREIAREIGAPIVGTSANRTKGPSPYTVDIAIEQLGDEVDLYIDGGPSKSNMDSTIIGIEEEEGMFHVKVYREGQLSLKKLEENLKVDTDALRYWTKQVVRVDM